MLTSGMADDQVSSRVYNAPMVWLCQKPVPPAAARAGNLRASKHQVLGHICKLAEALPDYRCFLLTVVLYRLQV